MNRRDWDDNVSVHYRDELALGPEARARTLRKLQERIARGEVPAPETDLAPVQLSAASGVSALSGLQLGLACAVLGLTASVAVWVGFGGLEQQPTAAPQVTSQPATAPTQPASPPTAEEASPKPTAQSETPLMAATPARRAIDGSRVATAGQRADSSRDATTRGRVVDGSRFAADGSRVDESRLAATHQRADGGLGVATTDQRAAAAASQQRGASPLVAADELEAAVSLPASGGEARGALPPAATSPSPSTSTSTTASASVAALAGGASEGEGAAGAVVRAEAAERAPRRGAEASVAGDLAKELRLIQAAQLALRAADPQRALALLAEHTWAFPQGQLAEARDVARIIALCQAGHEAQSKLDAKRFLQQRPDSPYAARVRQGCAR